MQYNFQPAGLSSESAAEIGDVLHQRLAGLLDLAMTLKHVHWNVVGPGFMAVHKMLDDHEAAVREMADAVAERIATLGGVPNGLPQHLTSTRTWDDYSIGRAVVEAHLGALDKVYDGVIGDHRKAIDSTGKLDPATEDILIGQTAELELQQWFIRAHIENTFTARPETLAPAKLAQPSILEARELRLPVTRPSHRRPVPSPPLGCKARRRGGPASARVPSAPQLRRENAEKVY